MNQQARQATRLWTLVQPTVSAFVTSVVRNFRDRDDVLQDIAVAVVESFENYDPRQPFLPWAMGVARNQIGLYLRRLRRDRLLFDDETIAALATAFAETAPGESRRLDFLHDCLKSLEGRARMLCELRYHEDLKPAAIAQALGMTANAVAKALQRIREQLRDCIERKAVREGFAT